MNSARGRDPAGRLASGPRLSVVDLSGSPLPLGSISFPVWNLPVLGTSECAMITKTVPAGVGPSLVLNVGLFCFSTLGDPGWHRRLCSCFTLRMGLGLRVRRLQTIYTVATRGPTVHDMNTCYTPAEMKRLSECTPW